MDTEMISVLQRVGTLELVLSRDTASVNLAETALSTLAHIARADPQLRDAVVAAGAAESVAAVLLQADEVSEHPHGGVPSAVLFTALYAAKQIVKVKPMPPIVGVYEQLVRAAARHLELCDATVSVNANRGCVHARDIDLRIPYQCSPRMHLQQIMCDVRGPWPMLFGLCSMRAWMTEGWTSSSTVSTFAPLFAQWDRLESCISQS